MKTQISNLINGSKEVRRNLENSKYNNAPKATSHNGFAGTNQEVREEVASKVLAENPTSITIEICGLVITLPKCQSTTGKTVWYETAITEEEFMQISGYAMKLFNKHKGSYSLKIYGDMTVCLNKCGQRNEKSEWKFRGYDWIGEEFVTIL